MTDHFKARSSKPFWRRFSAVVLDFVTVFVFGGYAIYEWSEGLRRSGFQLNETPALLLIALAAIYFYLGKHYDGTIWQRILKAR